MSQSNLTIQDVSDTAFWVAFYRAVETQRSDALFQDVLAAQLVGIKGAKIAASMGTLSEQTQFNIVIRTVVIDRFITKLVAEGVDCVINLGAGLDTRPYRMELPKSLQWIEVDQANIINLKNDQLAAHMPKCQLERHIADLANPIARQNLLANLAARGKKILVLTEGVLPYLTEDQVTALAQDLRAHEVFQYWIAEYISPLVYGYLRTNKRLAKMKNAPFQFFPRDWFGFFESRGWQRQQIEYLQDEGIKLGRVPPLPLFARLIIPFLSREVRASFLRASGFMVMKRTT